VRRERVAARSAARTDASEAGLDVLARQPSYWEPFDADELPHVIEVDTSVATSVTAALERITAIDRF
jgi:hypothetical protein